MPIETVGSSEYQSRFAAMPLVPPRATGPDTLAWLYYTSGTTGRSKGAMLSHRNLIAMTVSQLADFDAPDGNSSLLHGAPMSHDSGLYIPPYVLRGARQVIPASGSFEPDEFLDLCDHHPACSAFLAPTMVQRLVDTGRPAPRRPSPRRRDACRPTRSVRSPAVATWSCPAIGGTPTQPPRP